MIQGVCFSSLMAIHFYGTLRKHIQKTSEKAKPKPHIYNLACGETVSLLDRSVAEATWHV